MSCYYWATFSINIEKKYVAAQANHIFTASLTNIPIKLELFSMNINKISNLQIKNTKMNGVKLSKIFFSQS